VLTAQIVAFEDLQQKGIICPYVFHRPDGSRIKDFRETWKNACEKAGHPGKLFHDFRRSAVRTLERSGAPRSKAMAMVGHKTESIYRRYAIVDEQMHRERRRSWTRRGGHSGRRRRQTASVLRTVKVTGEPVGASRRETRNH
jgi:integrase